METGLYFISAAVAYLICGINPAIEISKRIYGADIRKRGSGNPGFTNFKRVYGSRWAWLVLLFDLAKGAVVTAGFAQLFEISMSSYQLGAAWTGLFALLGHSCPVWYGFKGGKGFLVYMSSIWVIDWHAGCVAVVVLGVLLLTTHYMSLATVSSMLSCPVTLAAGQSQPVAILLCIISVIYIAIRHKENFLRIKAGTESRFYLSKATG